MSQPVELGGGKGTAEGGSVLWSPLQAAGLHQQPFIRLRLQGVPQLVGPPKQGYIGRMLVVRQSDDAGQAVGRSTLMQQVVLLQAKDAPAPMREMCRGRAAHAPQSDDDGVVAHGS